MSPCLGGRAAATVGLLLAASACGSSKPAAAPPGPIVAAVVRSDGILVPFSVFDEGRWTGPPVGAITDRPEAWFADLMPALGAWTLRTPLGLTDAMGQPLTLTATGPPREVGSHCERVWGLTTDLPGQPEPDSAQARHVGIAFAGDATPRVVAEVHAVAAGEDRRARGFLESQFDAAEQRAVSSPSGVRGRPRRVGPAAAKSPVVITRLHRVGRVGDIHVYLFVAERAYASSRTSCDDLTIMAGWLGEGPFGAFSLIDSQIAFTDCRRQVASVVLPMATIEQGSLLTVFTVNLHYEGESYSVFQVSRQAVSRPVNVHAGGC